MSPKLWKSAEPVLLASTSATRLQLLRSVGLPVDTYAPRVDERVIEAEMLQRCASPEQIALELARAKGLDASSRYPSRWVVAADQTLALDGEQFHKPRSTEEARNQLRRLAGHTHHLHSAVVCCSHGQVRFQFTDSAHLQMRRFSKSFLDAYIAVAGDAVMMSVGGYQLEGPGAQLFSCVDGSHSTILGLPILPLLAFFRDVDLLEA